MAIIEVDYKKIDGAVEEIDRYVERIKHNMSSMDEKMTNLREYWEGSDYDQVMKEWNEITGMKSTTAKYITVLETYADELLETKRKYEDVQTKAINRARQYCQ